MKKKYPQNKMNLIIMLPLMLLTPFSGYQQVHASYNSENMFDQSTIQLWDMDNLQNRELTGKTQQTTLKAQASKGCSLTEGKYNDAIIFNGISGRIQLPDAAQVEFGPKESFTIDFWIKVFKQGQTQQIFSSTPYFEIEVRQEHGGVSFNLKAIDGSDASVRCVGAADITDGQWHYIGLVRNTRQKKLQVYVDGVLDGQAYDETFNKKVIIAANASIGGRPDGREMLAGIIDQLRISKGIRKFEEITDNASDSQIHEYKLENKLVKLVLKSQNNRLWLSQLKDKKNDAQLVHENLPPRLRKNIWQVNLKSDKYMFTLNERLGRLDSQMLETDCGKMLNFIWKDIPVEQDSAVLDVIVTILKQENY